MTNKLASSDTIDFVKKLIARIIKHRINYVGIHPYIDVVFPVIDESKLDNLDDIILYLHRKGFKMVGSSSGYYSFKTNRTTIYNEYVVIKDNGQQSLILTDNFHIKEIQKSLEELLYTRQKSNTAKS